MSAMKGVGYIRILKVLHIPDAVFGLATNINPQLCCWILTNKGTSHYKDLHPGDRHIECSKKLPP